MGIIDNTVWKEGDAPTAAQLNGPYDDLATFTIGQNNCKPNWATRAHFDASGTKANVIFYDEAVFNWNTTSTSYLLMDDGLGNTATLNINATANADHILRIQCSGLFGELVCNDDGDGTNATASYNCIGLRCVLFYNDGGPTLSQTIAECGYSFTTRSRVTTITDAVDIGTDAALWYRSFSFAGLWRVAAANRTIERVEFQGKVGPNGGAGNTLQIKHAIQTAVLVKE